MIESHLNYTFKNPTLLTQALTHPSALLPGKGVDFERLEFLGDRVLGLVVATLIFNTFPFEKEGEMARRFISLVRKETLVEVAYRLDLDKAMQMKKEKGAAAQKRLETTLADGCEALIGALYLDGGFEQASLFIQRYWMDILQSSQLPPHDPKSMLQEWAQGRGKNHPQYVTLQTSGPAHAPHFITEVRVEGLEPVQGTGSSKRLAERHAAEQLLARILHDS